MDSREILKELNSIDYSEKELKDLEHEAMKEKNRVSVELYKIKNDVILRKVTLLELEKKVKVQLSSDEEIKYKIIVLQGYLEKDVHIRYAGGLGTPAIVYLGVFVTDRRVLIYNLSDFYKLMEGEYIKDIGSLKGFLDAWEEYGTIGLKFNDGSEFMLRPVGEYNTKLFLEIIRYLKEESNSNFQDFKRSKMGIVGWVLFIILFILMFSVAFGAIKEALNKIP